MALNLYKLSYDHSGGTGEYVYDTYDMVIVAAPNEESARNIHPHVDYPHGDPWGLLDWAPTPADVTVELVGMACDSIGLGVVLASYNAG